MYNGESNNQGYFTIGGPGIGPESKSNFKWTSNAVESTKKVLNDKNRDILPDGDLYAVGLALITSEGRKRDRNLVPDLPILTKRKPFITLNDKPLLIEEIKASLQDLVVYGRAASIDGCNIFQV